MKRALVSMLVLALVVLELRTSEPYSQALYSFFQRRTNRRLT